MASGVRGSAGTCLRCGNRKARARQKFCSPDCRWTHERASWGGCEVCGKPKKGAPYRFCSPRCYQQARARERQPKYCQMCGTRMANRRKTCSLACRGASRPKSERILRLLYLCCGEQPGLLRVLKRGCLVTRRGTMLGWDQAMMPLRIIASAERMGLVSVVRSESGGADELVLTKVGQVVLRSAEE